MERRTGHLRETAGVHTQNLKVIAAKSVPDGTLVGLPETLVLDPSQTHLDMNKQQGECSGRLDAWM
jgi:hypothetical protein